MQVLFVFFSIAVVVFLLKCIYSNLEKPKLEVEAPPPPPTLQQTLISILSYFKSHILKVSVSCDHVTVYCFKNSPQDDISDYNEMHLRYCDLGFKSITTEDCKSLQEALDSAILPPKPEDKPKEDSTT